MATWTQAQVDEAVRKSLTAYELSLGSPVFTSGISWTAGIDNKLDIVVAPTVAPNGFDLFMTAQGNAIRFIGSGLGNGDSGNFEIITSFSIEVGTGQGQCTFKGKTRPYTEALFTNAVDINYVGSARNFPNNDLGALSLSPQIITLSDGDLVEFSANPVNAFSNVEFQWTGVLLREV